MRFMRVQLKNFKSFADADVPMHGFERVCVTGSNGAGKSTLAVDAPLWALFGKEHLDLDSVIGPFDKSATVILDVEVGNEVLRVTRSRSRSKSGMQVERLSGDDASPVASGANEAQAYVDRHILKGHGYDEFVASVYMVQGKHGTFTGATQAKAKEMFAGFLGLERWSVRKDGASELRREAEREHQTAEATYNALEEIDPEEFEGIEELEAQAERLTEGIDNFEARLTEAAADVKHGLQVAAQTAERKRAHEDAEAALVAARKDFDDADKSAKPMAGDPEDTVEELVAQLATHREARTAFDKHKNDVSRLKLEMEATDERLDKYKQEQEDAEKVLATFDEADTPTCTECKQSLPEESVSTLRKKHVDAVKCAAEKVANTLRSQEGQQARLKELEANAPDYKEGSTGRLEIKLDRRRDYESAQAALATKQEALDNAYKRAADAKTAADEATSVDLDALKQVVIDIEDSLAPLKVSRQSVESELATKRVKRARYEEVSTSRLKLGEKLLITEESLRTLQLAEKAFGRDGIPAYLVDAAVPQVEQAANELLLMMTGGMLTVRLETERELKSSKERREALDIIVSDGMTERPFSSFSGGEGFRINFALRVAISELVSQRSGLDLSFLVIDEPEGLDAAGRDLLVEALGVISDRFDTIVLISHHADLRDALPQRCVVTKTATGSVASFTDS